MDVTLNTWQYSSPQISKETSSCGEDFKEIQTLGFKGDLISNDKYYYTLCNVTYYIQGKTWEFSVHFEFYRVDQQYWPQHLRITSNKDDEHHPCLTFKKWPNDVILEAPSLS